MRITILYLLLACCSSSFCQETVDHATKTISGIVVSSDENLPVPFAHVYLKNSTIGTVSNSAGEFSLKLPGNQNNEIQISSIGFKTIAIRVPENSNETITIKLQPTTITLNEVVVSASEFDSGRYILQTALKFAKFNYPHKTHILEGFFREISYIDTLYNRLIEAAVRIQEVGYQKNTYDNEKWEFTRNKAEIIELRKSDDFRETDKSVHKMFGDRNELYRTFDSNYVRALMNKSNHTLSKDNLGSYDLNYVGRTEYENQEVYIVELKQRNRNSFQLNDTKIFITKADFAIVKIEFVGIGNTEEEKIPKEHLIDGKYWFYKEVNYRKINNTYYPFYISSKHSVADANYVVEKEGKTQKQYIHTQFLLTHVYDDDFSKIKWKDTEDRNVDLYKKEIPYNEDFWTNYNVIKLNPLNRVPTELEKEKSLEAQFKEEKKN